jgi:hypothetical protein
VSLPQIRADWAQHMLYGAWVGAAGAALVLVLAQVAGRPGVSLMAPVASLLAALAAGVSKEVADAMANRRRTAAPPHEVSAADVVATVAGALPVALSLFMAMWV